ncbi:uncharacterized protein LY89DRAFT_689765 [Mollisia scopiformis]|uniref:F-box domain-containing protein n=1 Tax=Mollisia scopiformis TaxID=149040 RepID=A0A132BDS2_MOLSC|nr:uncharacterized protein LY89DRAFT_689765 [Mollisia scopiformis]KUJ10570.1 hypothetical protein LY89DRAFT_689765 [Mollisia scopiformis]
MVVQPTGIGALPNEILISILSTFSTISLLPLTLTSHRFHSLIAGILYRRLIDIAQLKDRNLLLECYHPSTKLSTPSLSCEYLGTSELDGSGESSEADLYAGLKECKIGQLGKLAGLYSHFRPLKPEAERRTVRRHPAGGSFIMAANDLVDDHEEYVCQNVHLEAHERFSQLCTVTNVVKPGPRGLLLGCVNISDGVTRVQRHWLAAQARSNPETMSGEKRERLLWADNSENVGLKMRVKERDDGATPILVRDDEDEAVSYTLQYEELVIRTKELLLMVEKSIDQEVSHSGKAIVIGSWDQ